MKSVIIDALDIPGGQCSALYPEKPIYDIPAHEQITAANLVERLLEQAKPFNAEFLMSQMATGLKYIEGGFELTTSKNKIIHAKVILIAAGSGAFGPNKPPIKDIEEFEGKSVFYFIKNKNSFSGKKILIAGGGDSALDWALLLSEIAEVTLVHRRNKFTASPDTVRKLHNLVETGQVRLITNYQLHSLEGYDGMLQNVILRDLDGNLKTVDTDILLPFFGLAQNLGSILDWGIDIHNHKINVTLPCCATNINGIYAVGDVAAYPGKLKLILTGFSEVASALHHAYPMIFDGKALHFEHSTTKFAALK